MTKIEREIRSEIAKAVRHLGGSAELVATIEGKTKEQMYDAAEQLMPTANCWRQSARGATPLRDAEVLADLREWNAQAAAESNGR
jgi:hypothetical protein